MKKPAVHSRAFSQGAVRTGQGAHGKRGYLIQCLPQWVMS
jgi:hypothetical protein